MTTKKSILKTAPLLLTVAFFFLLVSFTACSSKVQITEAPVEVCSRLNLLEAKRSLDESERYTLYHTELKDRYTKAKRLYMEGEWAQQRGECEIAEKKGQKAFELTCSIPADYQSLAEQLDANQLLDAANIEIGTAEKQIESVVFPKAFKKIKTAKELFVKARSESDNQKTKAILKEARKYVMDAFRLRDLVLSDEIAHEMSKAKIVFEEALKFYAKAKELGLDRIKPKEMAEAEMYIKIARFDMEEKDPPEVAEFSLKAIKILELLVKGRITPTPAAR